MSDEDFSGGGSRPSYQPNFVTDYRDPDALQDIKHRLSDLFQAGVGALFQKPYYAFEERGRIYLYLDEPEDAENFRGCDIAYAFHYKPSGFNDYVTLHRAGLIPVRGIAPAP